jgi:alpha-1,3-rhamnosyl/mannosyltransferase
LALMSRPLRVGIDGTTWRNDRGFGRFTREIVKALAARAESEGFRYTLVVDHDPHPPATSAAATAGWEVELPSGTDLLHVPTGRPTIESAVGEGARSPLDLLRLGRAAGRARFDVFLFPAVYSYFPLLSRTPCAVVFHDTIAERFPELVFPRRRNRLFWNAKVALAKRQAQRAVTVSRASARDLESLLGIPAERIDVVSEAADPQFRPLDDAARLSAARSRAGCHGAEPLLLAVGGLSPHKNLRRLLTAMPAVFERHPEARLAIVGDTSGKGFFDEAEALQRAVRDQPVLAERVCFTGFVSDDELVALYNAATLLVFPSLFEGFGLPAIEAMACGLPVAASARGSLPEIVADAGRYFDPESVDEMTRVINELLSREASQVLQSLRARGLALAASYSWARAAAELEESLRRCAAGSRPGSRSGSRSEPGATDSRPEAAR